MIVRKQQFCALRQEAGEALSAYMARIDAVQRTLTQIVSRYSQEESYDKVEESLLPQYFSKMDQMSKCRTVDTVLVYMWLAACTYTRVSVNKKWINVRCRQRQSVDVQLCTICR